MFDQPVAKKLAEEAAALKQNEPDKWKAFDDRVAEVLAEHAKQYANWMKRAMPPRPNINALALPLNYLVGKIKENPDTCDVYVRAIADCADPRRVDFTLEYAEFHAPGGLLVADAMLPDRVEDVVKALLAKNPRIHTAGPIVTLAGKFHADLSEATRKAAYDYIRRQWDQGPSNGDGQRYWRVLLQLDANHGRHEIIQYYEMPKNSGVVYDLYVVEALLEAATPSAEVAAAAQQWLTAEKLHWYDDTQLRMLLVRSDPERQLDSYIKHIDDLIQILREKGSDRETQDPIDYQANALLQHLPEKAIVALRRFSLQPEITDIHRFAMLEYLVTNNDNEAESIVKKWMEQEKDYLRAWVHQKLPQLGELGKQLSKKY